MTTRSDAVPTVLAVAAGLLLAGMSGVSGVSGASAEVRFGKNVRIGGHDASNQTFDSRRRGEYHIYSSTPRNPGCSWRHNADGSRTKVCHLQRK